MKRFCRVSLLLLIALAVLTPAVRAQDPVEQTVRAIMLRLRQEQPHETLLSLDSARLAALLSDEERGVLADQYLTFRVNVPVTVFVAIDPDRKGDIFWLQERGFEETDLVVGVNDEIRLAWRRDFPAGEVGLGVSSLSGGGDHYFVIVAPRDPAAALSVSEVVPSLHTLGVARKGEYVLADEDDELIVSLPPELEGLPLIRGYGGREKVAHIAGFFRTTPFPSSEKPDQVLVTVGEDPQTSMTIQWRTSTAVPKGVVRYQKKELVERFSPAPPLEALAETVPVEDLGLLGDTVIHRHFATLRHLEPGTTYLYSVGDGTEDNWSQLAEFTTAPATATAFSFLYMGDIQTGFPRWASLKRRALLTCPDAAFCLTAGDQVNRGYCRDDWDALFHYAHPLFANVPLAPTIGNHEMYQGRPRLYLELLALPRNGPPTLTPERAYSFRYGQLLVLSLDSNAPPDDQVPWLEEQLASSDAVWKIVLYHHPAYSSDPGRDNPHIRDTWGPIFDKYGVDLVFQGHDHGYLRTYPMRGGRPLQPTERGTIYLITVAGTKMYEVDPRDYGQVVIQDDLHLPSH